MKLRALVNFSGVVSSTVGQEFEANEDTAKDLIKAGYAEPVAAKSGKGSEGGNTPTTPPQTPPQVKKTEEEEAPATSTAKVNNSGAEKDK